MTPAAIVDLIPGCQSLDVTSHEIDITDFVFHYHDNGLTSLRLYRALNGFPFPRRTNIAGGTPRSPITALDAYRLCSRTSPRSSSSASRTLPR